MDVRRDMMNPYNSAAGVPRNGEAGQGAALHNNLDREAELHDLFRRRVVESAPPVIANNTNDKNAQTSFFASQTTLLTLIQKGNISHIAPLITADNINSVIYKGKTSLWWACYYGKKEVVKWLLENKADIHAENENSMKAIHGAALAGQLEICRLLMAQKADVHAVTTDKTNLLHLTAQNGSLDVIKLFLGAGVAMEAVDSFGKTPLAYAIYHGKEAAGMLLLNAGASILNVMPYLYIPDIPHLSGEERSRIQKRREDLIGKLIEMTKQKNKWDTFADRMGFNGQLRKLAECCWQLATLLFEAELRITRSDENAFNDSQLLEEIEAKNADLKTNHADLKTLNIAELPEQVTNLLVQLSQMYEELERSVREGASIPWKEAEKKYLEQIQHWNEAQGQWRRAQEQLQLAEERVRNEKLKPAQLSSLIKERNQRRTELLRLNILFAELSGQARCAVENLRQMLTLHVSQETIEELQVIYKRQLDRVVECICAAQRAFVRLERLESKQDDEAVLIDKDETNICGVLSESIPAKLMDLLRLVSESLLVNNKANIVQPPRMTELPMSRIAKFEEILRQYEASETVAEADFPNDKFCEWQEKKRQVVTRCLEFEKRVRETFVREKLQEDRVFELEQLLSQAKAELLRLTTEQKHFNVVLELSERMKSLNDILGEMNEYKKKGAQQDVLFSHVQEEESFSEKRQCWIKAHEQLRCAQEAAQAMFVALEAAFKRQVLESEWAEVYQGIVLVESDLREQQKRADVQDEAFQLAEKLPELEERYSRALMKLHHAKKMAVQERANEKDRQKLAERKMAFDSARAAYVANFGCARDLKRKGFEELKYVLKEAPWSFLSMEDFRIESSGDAILKATRGNRIFALKRRASGLLEREYHVLRRLQHPYVIGVETLIAESDSMAVLVLPWIGGGTLDHYLATAKATHKKNVRKMFRCIFQGLSHVHASGVVHGKLSLGNILMASDGRPRICDFDRSIDATFVSADDDDKMPEKYDEVMLEYCAPELLQTPPQPKSKASDVYALGVCLWKAFFPNWRIHMLETDPHPTMPSYGVLPGLSHVLEWMLKRDPKKRPTIDEVLQFPLFDDKFRVASKKFQQMKRRIEAFSGSIYSLLGYYKEEKFLVTIQPKEILREAPSVLWFTHHILRLRFSVLFKGEEGIDEGALTAAMYVRFLKAACESQFFVCGPQGKYLPCPASTLDEEAVLVYRGVGVALARTLVDERTVVAPFASALFKFLQVEEVTCKMNDLDDFDFQQSRNMLHLLSPNGDCSLYGFEDVGEPIQDVTPQNKQVFVKKFIQWNLIGARLSALRAIREGFHSLGPEFNQYLCALKWRDVKLLLSGMVNSADVLNRLQFEGFGPQDQTPQYLRQVIREMSSETLQRFILFVTGLESLPIVYMLKPKPIRVLRIEGANNRLPVSHACFWELELPEYTHADALRERLMLALENSGTFSMQ